MRTSVPPEASMVPGQPSEEAQLVAQSAPSAMNSKSMLLSALWVSMQCSLVMMCPASPTSQPVQWALPLSSIRATARALL